MVEALMRFTERQITEARTLLWNIARVNSDKVGEVKGYVDARGNIHARRGEKKASESLSDIHKLVIKLQELNLMPLLLGTSESVSRLPPFNTNPEEIKISDVLIRMTTIENSLNSFIKQQNENMQSLSTAVGNIENSKAQQNSDNQPNIQNRRIMSIANENENFPRLSQSPNKRKRVEEVLSSDQYSAGTWANVAGINRFSVMSKPPTPGPGAGGPRRTAPLVYGYK